MRLLLASLAAAVSLAPPGPPPKIGPSGPPPAWIEVGGRSVWLAYSSYCWRTRTKTLCADYVPPSYRKDIPTVRARRGEAARLHFGFRPRRVTVGTQKLAPGRVTRWRVTKAGLALIFVLAPAGDASYVVRVRLR